jgi:hypothetical protein
MYTKDADITMAQVADYLKIHQSVFRAYITETLPGFANIKRSNRPVIEDAIEAIRANPILKNKYDQAVNMYVKLEVTSMSKAASKAGVKLPLFRIYLQKVCPDYQDKRIALTTATYYNSLPNKDMIERYRERLKSMMGVGEIKHIRKQDDGSSYCDLCLCRIRGQKSTDILDHYDSIRHQDSLKAIGEKDALKSASSTPQQVPTTPQQPQKPNVELSVQHPIVNNKNQGLCHLSSFWLFVVGQQRLVQNNILNALMIIIIIFFFT